MKKPKTPAMDLFDKFVTGYNERNLPLLLSLFTDESTVWGTGLDEYRKGLKELEGQFKRDWSQAQKGSIEIISSVPTNDDTWAAAIAKVRLTIDGKEYTFDDFRTTMTVKKYGNEWKILHAHSSFPDMRNPESGSFPVNA